MNRSFFLSFVIAALMISGHGMIAAPCALSEEASPDVVIIRLKSKGSLKGVIKGENDGRFVVDVGFGTVEVPKDDIEEIETPKNGEKNKLVEEWREHASGTGLSGDEREKDRKRLQQRVDKSLELKKEMAAGGTVIKFKDRSRIVVRAVLNDEIEMPLLVDTGATSVFISPPIARKLGYRIGKSSEEVSVSLADGTLRRGVPIVLRSVAVGDVKATNVDAIVTKYEKGESGILGMSFLKRFHLRIDSEKKELILRKK